VYSSQSKFLINTKGIPREYSREYQGNTYTKGQGNTKGIPREYQGNTKGIHDIYD
jgi:hypothetical protein